MVVVPPQHHHFTTTTAIKISCVAIYAVLLQNQLSRDLRVILCQIFGMEMVLVSKILQYIYIV